MAEEGKEGGEAKAKKKDGGDEKPPKKQKHEEHVNHERWLVSYADFITLLFAFFTVLYAIGQSDISKLKAVEKSFREAFQGGSKQFGVMNTEAPAQPYPIEFGNGEGILDRQEINRNTEKSLVDIKDMVDEYSLSDEFEHQEFPEEINSRLKERIYFKKNELNLMENPNISFEQLIKMLTENQLTLMIEGHASADEGTDETDKLTLSFLRAKAMANVFLKRGFPSNRIVISPRGDTRPNFLEAQDMAKNRRIEFVFTAIDPNVRGHRVE
jgi:chemotaxis protein MotB